MSSLNFPSHYHSSWDKNAIYIQAREEGGLRAKPIAQVAYYDFAVQIVDGCLPLGEG